MPKIYIDYHDHHNRPILMTFEDESHAMKWIALAEGVHEKEVWEALFNDAGDDCFGEYWGRNAWFIVTREGAIAAAEYWSRVSDAIGKDEKAPTS